MFFGGKLFFKGEVMEEKQVLEIDLKVDSQDAEKAFEDVALPSGGAMGALPVAEQAT